MIKLNLSATKLVARFYDNDNNELTGLSDVTFSVYRESDLWFYDWNDLTFKASGHTTLDGAGLEVDAANAPGDYYIAWTPPADDEYITTATSPTAANINPTGHVQIYGQIEADLELIRKIETGRWRISANQMFFYETGNNTPFLTFDLKDSGGNPTTINPKERVPV